MNNPPASAASPVPASADTNMASTIIAFLARLLLNAPQAWLRQSGQRRRDFKRASGEAMAVPFRSRFGSEEGVASAGRAVAGKGQRLLQILPFRLARRNGARC